MPPRAGDDRWLEAVQDLVDAARAFHPDALVVSLGVDAAVDDPESPLRVTRDGIRATGILLGTPAAEPRRAVPARTSRPVVQLRVVRGGHAA